MNEYQFILELPEHTEITNDLIDKVYKSGCDDCVVTSDSTTDKISLYFIRKSYSYYDALTTAERQLESVGINTIPRIEFLPASHENKTRIINAEILC